MTATPLSVTEAGTNGKPPATLKTYTELADIAQVEPADVLTARKVGELLPAFAAYQGLARQAAIDSLRILIGYLPTEERAILAPALMHHKLVETQKELERFLEACPAPPGTPKFKPLTLADLLAMPPKAWLVDQVIGAGDLAMLYGAPGSGKTFVVLDLLFAACTGQRFARRFGVARPLQVAYCAGEGASGLPARFAAAALNHSVGDIPGLTVFTATPQLFDPAANETIFDFVHEWKNRQAAGAARPLDLLVIDTMHAATVGAEENSATDAGKVLAAAKYATRELGCAVLLVHHANKAGTGERGSSALRGAMDAMLEIKQTSGKYAMRCEKLKDGEQWKPQTFDLVKILMAMGESDGDTAFVRWDEVSGDTAGSGEAKIGEKLLTEMTLRPGMKFTAKLLGEAVGASQDATRNSLNRMADNGVCQRALADEAKGDSDRNKWVYFIPAENFGS